MCLKAKWLFQPALSPIIAALCMCSGQALAESIQRSKISTIIRVVSAKANDLHVIILWICIVIGILVFVVMIYSIFAHRQSKTFKPSTFNESTGIEIVWTVIPFIILIVMALPATTMLLGMYNIDNTDADVIVTGHQWKWKYEYINVEGEDIVFFSNLRTRQGQINNEIVNPEHDLLRTDKPLILPANKKVRFRASASDISDSWTLVQEPGIYRGQCVEPCRKSQRFMPTLVNILVENEFNRWMANKQIVEGDDKNFTSPSFEITQLVDSHKSSNGQNQNPRLQLLESADGEFSNLRAKTRLSQVGAAQGVFYVVDSTGSITMVYTLKNT